MSRMQASIEFLLMLSAISLVCLGLIALYSGALTAQKVALGSFGTQNTAQTQNISTEALNSPASNIYMPLNSTVGHQGAMEFMFYGCNHGEVSVNLNSTRMLLSDNGFATNFSNLLIKSIYFNPLSEGQDTVNVSYSIECQGANISDRKVFVTYASVPEVTYQGSGLSAGISNRNESTAYWLSHSSNVFSLSETNRCTQLNFWGNPIGIASQCGTSNAWDYNIFSDYCYTEGGSTTETYCILPNQAGYNIASIDSENPVYNYSFILQIYSPAGIFESNISNLRPRANVTLNGKPVGFASVSSVSDNFQPIQQQFIDQGGVYTALNSSVYSGYTQALNNLYSTLSYYNGSGISGDAQSTIQQAVAYYQKEESEITPSVIPNSTSCHFSRDSYKCNSPLPFSYVINVTLSGYQSIGKQAISSQGSLININES